MSNLAITYARKSIMPKKCGAGADIKDSIQYQQFTMNEFAKRHS